MVGYKNGSKKIALKMRLPALIGLKIEPAGLVANLCGSVVIR
jgi:hypothetical protein